MSTLRLRSRRLVVAAGAVLIGCQPAASVGHVPRLQTFDARALHGVLGSTQEGVLRVERDADAACLRVYTLGSTEGAVIVLCGDAPPTRVRLPSRRAFLSNDGSAVAWLDDAGGLVRFHTGQELRSDAGFGMDYGGRFYFSVVDDGSVIGESAAPGRVIQRTNLMARSIFVTPSRMLLCGTKPGSPREWACDVIGRAADEWKTERRVDFGKLAVIDVDPLSDLVLLKQQMDDPFKSALYVYDIATEERRSAGEAEDYALFLKQLPKAVATHAVEASAR